jgi:uncharacterized phage protein gp47/JayE
MIIIPTISQLYNTLKADIEANMQVSINLLGKVYLRANALAYAGKLKLLYLVLGQIQKNIAPDICDEETLLRYGKVKLNRYLYPGVEGQYELQVTGTIGATIPALTIFKSDDASFSPGILYQLDQAYVLVSNPDTITVRALTAGEEGKLIVNDTLTSTTPIALVSSNVFVVSEVVQPIDEETIEDYRAAVVLAFRLEPKGGADADYILWSLDAAGVKTVYPYAKTGESSAVVVYVEAKLVDSIDGQGTPTQAIMDDVEDVINFSPDISLSLPERGRRPTDVRLYIEPITVKQIVINIANFQGLTGQITTDITNALTDYVANLRPFIAGANVIANKNDIIAANGIIQTISNTVPGASYGTVTFTVDGISYADYTFVLGNIPWLQTVNIT